MTKKIWGGKKISEIINDAEKKQEKINALFEGVQGVASQINATVSDANEKLASISSIEDDTKKISAGVQGAVEDIQAVKDEINELSSTVKELLAKAEVLTDEIKAQLGTAAGGSLAHTFDDRKKELEKSKNNWRIFFLINIIALFVVALVVFFELKSNQGFSNTLWLKITLAFPLIYSAIFFHSQYNKEREYVEEYAFKSAVALSLQAYKELFKDEIDSEKPAEQEKFLDFISNTTRQIYVSPREIISAHPSKEESVELSILEKLIEMFKKLKG